ncbi:MAG: A/G-specific adenine glycosylase [Clostridia bacterium]|nr:A/G-specific adenine glycosylase [Clostridia bacterium]
MKTLHSGVPALLDWYCAVRRPLPFRENPTPYRVWVSEVMLQQTRIEAAIPYFERFMDALPTVADLAATDEDRLLKLWEGLGYYSRVRNLQKAAQQVMERHGGELPADYDQLLALSGIGEYTAGAIASIAYGLPVPAVDGNVLRVFARLTAHRGDVLKPAVRRELREVVCAVLPKDAPGLFNEAVMELGETVCLPNTQPHCEVCPLSAVCAAHAAGIEAELPTRAAPKPRRIEQRTVVCVTTDEPTPRVWLRKRPATGLLAKLWEFPQVEGTLSAAEAAAAFDLQPKTTEQLPPAKHVFSHLEWQMTGVHLTVAPFDPPAGTVLVTAEEQRTGHALPGAFAAYAAYLNKWLSKRE